MGPCWLGCHTGTPASILPLLEKASHIALLAGLAQHRRSGDTPTRRLEHQPHEHVHE